MVLSNAINAASSGLQVLNSSNLFISRSLAQTSNQTSISNSDGISGNPTISLTAPIYISGISFNSGTNILSAYSVGTFTPVITGAGSNPTPTYSLQIGRYTKINNRIITSIGISLSAISGGSGNARFSIPFTASSSLGISIGAANVQNFTTTASYFCTLNNPNNTFFLLTMIASASALANAQATLSNTFTLKTTIEYGV